MRCSRLLPCLTIPVCLLVAPHARAFNGNRVTTGPLTVAIQHLPTVTERDRPQDVLVTLDNAADAGLAVRLELKGLIDPCRAVGRTRQEVSIPAKGALTVRFQVAFPKGCYSALYPIHVHAGFDQGGQALTAHAVEIVTTDFTAADRRDARPAAPGAAGVARPVSAGAGPRTLTAAERTALLGRARGAVAAGRADGEDVFLFPLASGCRAALALGPNGLLDGALAFGTADRQVAFAGLRAAVLGRAAGRWPAPLLTEAVTAARDAGGRLRVVHRLRLGDDAFNLTVTAWADRDGLRVCVACPRPIADLAVGPADRTAGRVYFGHGFCVVEPGAFRVSGGGHGLAASHVAYDFDAGLSLLVAADTPPDFLEVDPRQRLYALHAHPDTTFTFVPGGRGAFDCAVRYRPLCDRRAAPGVARKAGRFVFDLWGGRYEDNATLLRRAFAYGLDDSLVVLHVWQRWGYDYRLPDVFPPDPRLGTLADLQALARLCVDRDVPFALHDNYIDFYPDADDFTYDHITFDADGRPRRAWLNEGRAAQSYQFRPDHILPFVRRNLEQIQPHLRPTAYFLDVFTSMTPFDYHDRQGTFHSRTETLRCWGEAFDAIRGQLGGDALMIDRPGLLRRAVRKYWLAQDVARRLARDRIASVTFAGGDAHRQVIAWESGARVCVNRGADDWAVDGHTLPPFGYLARTGEAESSVERLAGTVVERSQGRGTFYVNGRGASGDVDFGIVKSRGAVRCQAGADSLTVTPLPDGEDFRLCLRPGRLRRPPRPHVHAPCQPPQLVSISSRLFPRVSGTRASTKTKESRLTAA